MHILARLLFQGHLQYLLIWFNWYANEVEYANWLTFADYWAKHMAVSALEDEFNMCFFLSQNLSVLIVSGFIIGLYEEASELFWSGRLYEGV